MNLVLMIQENPFLRGIFRNISRFVKFYPFYLSMETFQEGHIPGVLPGLNPLEVSLLDSSDIKTISESCEINIPEEKLQKQLENGCICMGLKYHGEIVAYSWCDLKMCRMKSNIFPLKDDEAFLFSIRTFSKFRGKNLAPFLRQQLFRYLSDRGRTKFYNITISLNSSSMKLMEKSRSKANKKLYLYVGFLGKRHYYIPVWRFTNNQKEPES